MRILFLGSHDLSYIILEELINFGFDVIAVVTSPSTEILFKKYNKKIYIPEKIDEDFIKIVLSLNIDLAITVAYGKILPIKFLESSKFGTINIHPSLLPKYRGAAPVQRSILQNDKITGVSIIETVYELDAGDILWQKQLEIDNDINSYDLMKKLFLLSLEGLTDVITKISQNKIIRKKQHGRITYANKIKKEEGLVTFESSLQVHNKVRSLYPWPLSYCYWYINGIKTKIILHQTKVIKKDIDIENGEIIFNDDGFYLKCKDNSLLKIIKLQKPGKKVLFSRDFYNGIKKQKLSWINK